MNRFLLACAGLLLTGATLRAEQIMLWEFPASYTPAPESFLVSYRSSAAPQTVHQFRIPNQGRPSCDGVTKAPGLTPDSVCGRPPDCLPPAIYVFVVQAEAGEQRSAESPSATCEAKGSCTFDCQGVSLPPELQALAQTPEGKQEPQPPDPQKVQDAVTTLAERPTPPATASITKPSPTTSDIPEKVTTALNQLPKAPV